MDTNELITGGASGGGLFDSVSTSALLASVWWGAISTGFLIYGWKQKSMLPFFAGLVMGATSYFFLDSALYMSVICVVTLAVFFWLKKQGY